MGITSLSQLYASYNDLVSYFKTPANAPNVSTQVWSPPQWLNQPSDQQQLFYAKTAIQTGDGTKSYFFDAVLRVEHNSEMRITEHPIQTGANISDHAYQMPARLIFEIGMSDAMATLGPNSWSNAYTKSVSAYQTLLSLMQSRIALNIHTRLYTYSNMLIESIRAPDDYKTQFGGKFTVNFRQIITAQVSLVVSSSRSATTITNSGSVNITAAPDSSLLSAAIGS